MKGAQGPAVQRGEALGIREAVQHPGEVATESSSCPHILGFSGRVMLGEEDGQGGKLVSLSHRGLGAWLPLQGQLVELILCLILIQRHLQHTGLIKPTHWPLPCCSQEPTAQSPGSQCPTRGHSSALSPVQKLDSGQESA